MNANDIMTSKVLPVGSGTLVTDVARLLLARRRIKRVPVLEHGQLVGIVSRSDLVRALAVATRSAHAGPIADEAIRAGLLTELRRQAWWRKELSSVSRAGRGDLCRLDRGRERAHRRPGRGGKHSRRAQRRSPAARVPGSPFDGLIRSISV